MLPMEDKTPQAWELPQSSIKERIKKRLRQFFYPFYLRLINLYLTKKYGGLNNTRTKIDQWYWGHRGLEYELLRRKLHQFSQITDKDVLIAGCGTARDIPAWLDFHPSSLVGIDYFDYQRAWSSIVQKYSNNAQISFLQGDLNHLDTIPAHSFDIIGSDAVFEHLQNLPRALSEFHRVLRPGGIVYATFGPLWYCWAGDHVSGYDANVSGYNHLLLEDDLYQEYLANKGDFSHSEDDGRTWIQNKLFSYLRPREYIAALKSAGFEKIYLGIVLEPRAIEFLKENPASKENLLQKNSKFDLIVTGMSLIFRRIN